MTDNYLNVAERILNRQRAPMSARQIMLVAQASGLLPQHLYGPTQHKTLHARLSVDIARNREGSRFFRTAPGRFFLRRHIDDASLPAAYRSEYLAKPRRKELRRDPVLTVYVSDDDQKAGGSGTPVSIEKIRQDLISGSFTYNSYSSVINNPSLALVYSFVVVHRFRNVLSFRVGKFTARTDPLYGQRSLGVGGAVFTDDVDMLFDSMNGVIANGISELTYAIGLPRTLAERARYRGELLPWGAFLTPPLENRPRLIHVIMGYKCPPEFTPSKNALSINDLKWISLDRLPNDLNNYDNTSRYLLERSRIDLLEERQVDYPC